MRALAKYTIFITALLAATLALSKSDLPSAHPTMQRTGISSAFQVPPVSDKPSFAVGGLYNVVNYSGENNLIATGGEGIIRFWRMPDKKPVLEINTDEKFRVLHVRFLPGKDAIAAGGKAADGSGSIRVFSVVSGKQMLRLDDAEPVLFMDLHPGGKLLLTTGISNMKIWDMAEGRIISVIPKSTAASKGVFFMEGRYVLQSGSLTLYNWTGGKRAGILDSSGPAIFKKVHDTLYAWISGGGLSMIRTPHGRKEYIPLDTEGVYGFDVDPTGKWAFLLKEHQKMVVIDCMTGMALKTIKLDHRPVDVMISPDSTSAGVIYGSGKVDVFDIGNANTFRKMRIYAVRLFREILELIDNAGSGYRKHEERS
ncbi:MAG: hypothetical protein M1147_10095 [Nitrospirae bacterium]|nr:hypothetical protein [Nitrospirota bacterium]MCL5978445.1 hypothetical protein [Nitrospirota bacterium]